MGNIEPEEEVDDIFLEEAAAGPEGDDKMRGGSQAGAFPIKAQPSAGGKPPSTRPGGEWGPKK